MEKYLYKDLDDLENTHFWHIAKRRAALNVLTKFRTKSNLKILDLGCGTGANIKELKSFGEVWGADSSKDAIYFCNKKGIKTVKQAYAEKLPFKKEEFNLVTMFDVLEHIEEKESLEEVKRVLKADGKLLITVPAFTWLWSQWDEVLHHKRRYTKQSLSKALKAAGFEVTFISYMYSFLVLPALITRFIKSLIYKGDYPSDFKLSSPTINRLLLFVSDTERQLVLRTGIPFGTSVICLARKK